MNQGYQLNQYIDSGGSLCYQRINEPQASSITVFVILT